MSADDRDIDHLAGIEFRHLRYFAAVAEAGSVTEAARRLRIAQPSLSQQIRGLEKRVGVPLFVRGAAGMTLTDAGRTLFDGVRRALGELTATLATVRGPALALSARVGTCRGIEQNTLAAAEQIITRDQPVRLMYQAADSHEQAALLLAGALDFGILRAPVDAKGLIARVVSDEELGITLAAAHPLADREALTWADLEGQRLLSFPESRLPGYPADVLIRLAAHGWHVRADPGDHDHSSYTLFRHALLSGGDVVALRPRGTVGDDAALRWIPVGPHPPRERVILAAVAGTLWSRLLS